MMQLLQYSNCRIQSAPQKIAPFQSEILELKKTDTVARPLREIGHPVMEMSYGGDNQMSLVRLVILGEPVPDSSKELASVG